MRPLLMLRCGCDTAVVEIAEVLENNALRVMLSFDSSLAAGSTVCPHHGPEQCDCQIVILLVYGDDGRPATLMAHGQDGETWISIAASPGQRPSPGLENAIKRVISPLSATVTAK